MHDLVTRYGPQSVASAVVNDDRWRLTIDEINSFHAPLKQDVSDNKRFSMQRGSEIRGSKIGRSANCIVNFES